MSHASDSVEQLVRSYLTSRSFVNTAKSFETECAIARDGKYQVDRFMEELSNAMDNLDIEKVAILWAEWNGKIFNSLDPERVKLAQQYEADTYRLFLVRCTQKNNIQKCNEFFQRLSSLTQNNPQWIDWFSFPYNPNAKNSEPFKKYFDKTWQEIFLISLYNFLAVSLPAAASTPLVKLVEDVTKEQNNVKPGEFDEELMDDFAVIAQCSSPVQRAHSKPTLRNILKSLTGSKRSTD
ncbi:unnamed protein product [Caenorhabditis bovis]|uniref:ARMC9 CTLH-like domain-containing protein n=1 Tax=Caenorhabditis bovis TaxID=2654633 RepID=A0A8S1EG66_9PELO|nr:unnamed protein product [Caenorhabditis bovis]